MRTGRWKEECWSAGRASGTGSDRCPSGRSTVCCYAGPTPPRPPPGGGPSKAPSWRPPFKRGAAGEAFEEDRTEQNRTEELPFSDHYLFVRCESSLERFEHDVDAVRREAVRCHGQRDLVCCRVWDESDKSAAGGVREGLALYLTGQREGGFVGDEMRGVEADDDLVLPSVARTENGSLAEVKRGPVPLLPIDLPFVPPSLLTGVSTGPALFNNYDATRTSYLVGNRCPATGCGLVGLNIDVARVYPLQLTPLLRLLPGRAGRSSVGLYRQSPGGGGNVRERANARANGREIRPTSPDTPVLPWPARRRSGAQTRPTGPAPSSPLRLVSSPPSTAGGRDELKYLRRERG